jgi:hypothetical protein
MSRAGQQRRVGEVFEAGERTVWQRVRSFPSFFLDDSAAFVLVPLSLPLEAQWSSRPLFSHTFDLFSPSFPSADPNISALSSLLSFSASFVSFPGDGHGGERQ